MQGRTYDDSIHPSTSLAALNHPTTMREAPASDCWIKLKGHFFPSFVRKSELTYLQQIEIFQTFLYHGIEWSVARFSIQRPRFDLWAGFSPSISVFPCKYHSTSAPFSNTFIYNRHCIFKC